VELGEVDAEFLEGLSLHAEQRRRGLVFLPCGFLRHAKGVLLAFRGLDIFSEEPERVTARFRADPARLQRCRVVE
jgi:hypothetical protein